MGWEDLGSDWETEEAEVRAKHFELGRQAAMKGTDRDDHNYHNYHKDSPEFRAYIEGYDSES